MNGLFNNAITKTRKKYSYVDYLTWDESERWELLDGVPYMQAAPSRIHQEISMELSTQFHNYLKGKTCRVFAAPFCVRLDMEKNDYDIKNVVEPDITIVCDSSKLDERGCKGTPYMIVEILSPSTGKKDRVDGVIEKLLEVEVIYENMLKEWFEDDVKTGDKVLISKKQELAYVFEFKWGATKASKTLEMLTELAENKLEMENI